MWDGKNWRLGNAAGPGGNLGLSQLAMMESCAFAEFMACRVLGTAISTLSVKYALAVHR